MGQPESTPGTITIPAWLGTKLIPIALIAFMGSSFSWWLDLYDLKNEVAHLRNEFHDFKSSGERYPLSRGAGSEARISKNESDINRLEIAIARAEVRIEQLMLPNSDSFRIIPDNSVVPIE